MAAKIRNCEITQFRRLLSFGRLRRSIIARRFACFYFFHNQDVTSKGEFLLHFYFNRNLRKTSACISK